jgi:copper chaperone CopZ
MSQPFELAVDGMHCQACVRRVKAALAAVPGVIVDEVTVGHVRGELDGAARADVAAAIASAGFTPIEAAGEAGDGAGAGEAGDGAGAAGRPPPAG